MSEEYIVKFEHSSAKQLVTVLEALGNIVDEALFRFAQDGLTVKALDPAQIALIVIRMPSEAFLEYNIEKDLEVGVNVNNLVKTLPKPKKGDKFVFKANEEFYEVIIEGISTKRYKYRSIEVSAQEVGEITPEFKVSALVVARAFKEALKDLKGAGTITFVAEDDQYLYLKALEVSAEARLSRVGGSILEMEVKEPSRANYDEDYILKVLNLTGVTDAVNIKFGNDVPLYLSFTLVEGGSVEYLLAPKM